MLFRSRAHAPRMMKAAKAAVKAAKAAVKAAKAAMKAGMARTMRKKPKKRQRKHLPQNARGCARLKICVAISELIPVRL